MYIHLGQDTVVKKESIIGIFDTVSGITRNFLNLAEKQGRVVNVSFELPKSFVVCSENGKLTVYISQLSPTTLEKRNADGIV